MRKKTLRRLPPLTRRVARLLNDLDSVTRRLKNLLPEIQEAEMWEIASHRATTEAGKRAAQALATLRTRIDQGKAEREGRHAKVLFEE